MSAILSNNHYLFTSESVSEGHPDKLCDQVSDAILDACLAGDKNSHVACETYATTGMVVVGGEISTTANIDVQKIVRDVVRDIGYTDEDYGISADSMAVLNVIHNQSPDINQGVVGTGLKEYEGQQGAGDQGIMFGFATNETPEYMPATLVYAHKILRKAAELRKNGTIKWLRPDSKSQVTIEYDENHKPVRIDAVVVSHQHNPEVDYDTIKKTIIEQIVKPVLEPTGLLDKDTKYYINPTGRFVVGGPHGDAGLTGRKIIVDTYGGMGRHGGGAFSGKDPSKVDRSAAYMARYIAKNIVAAGLFSFRTQSAFRTQFQSWLRLLELKRLRMRKSPRLSKKCSIARPQESKKRSTSENRFTAQRATTVISAAKASLGRKPTKPKS